MTQAAAVRIGNEIRISGDPEMAREMCAAFAVPEMERLRRECEDLRAENARLRARNTYLRTELGIHRAADDIRYRRMIAEAREKYKPKRVSRLCVFWVWLMASYQAWRTNK